MEVQNNKKLDFNTYPEDHREIWKKLISYCKKKRRCIYCYYKVPSEEVENVLKFFSNKEKICQWILSVKEEPTHINTKPLERPELGPVGTPVYAYSLPFEGRIYYLALFEKKSQSTTTLFIKSLKFDESHLTCF